MIRAGARFRRPSIKQFRRGMSERGHTEAWVDCPRARRRVPRKCPGGSARQVLGRAMGCQRASMARSGVDASGEAGRSHRPCGRHDCGDVLSAVPPLAACSMASDLAADERSLLRPRAFVAQVARPGAHLHIRVWLLNRLRQGDTALVRPWKQAAPPSLSLVGLRRETFQPGAVTVQRGQKTKPCSGACVPERRPLSSSSTWWTKRAIQCPAGEAAFLRAGLRHVERRVASLSPPGREGHRRL